jgi:hypothetical protein
MCRFSVEEASQLQGTISGPFAKQECYRMIQYLPNQPAGKVSEVPRPQTLYRVALGELGEDCIFGIVTFFEYRLYEVGPLVMGGMAMYPATEEVLKFYREFTEQAPEELTTIAILLGLAPRALRAGRGGRRSRRTGLLLLCRFSGGRRGDGAPVEGVRSGSSRGHDLTPALHHVGRAGGGCGPARP